MAAIWHYLVVFDDQSHIPEFEAGSCMLKDVGERSLPCVIYNKGYPTNAWYSYMTTWNIYLLFDIWKHYWKASRQTLLNAAFRPPGLQQGQERQAWCFCRVRALMLALKMPREVRFETNTRLDKNILSTWQMESCTLNGLLGQSWLSATACHLIE